jgi:hypothetical protein
MRKILVILIAFFACKGQNSKSFVPDFISGPPTIVYKTKGDYNKLVPVLLSNDKSEIISYPHPKDLMVGGQLALPTILEKGYLLDNRGVGENVAFLKMTYEEYSKLENAPSLKEMYSLIIDKDPLMELCNCGNSKVFSDKVNQLNKVIKADILRTTCRTIK